MNWGQEAQLKPYLTLINTKGLKGAFCQKPENNTMTAEHNVEFCTSFACPIKKTLLEGIKNCTTMHLYYPSHLIKVAALYHFNHPTTQETQPSLNCTLACWILQLKSARFDNGKACFSCRISKRKQQASYT